MKFNSFIIFIVSFLIGLIILCAVIADKPLFQKEATLQDVLSPNPLTPWGVREITNDIKRNEVLIRTFSKDNDLTTKP